MDTFEKNVIEILQCPICFMMPRSVPITSCAFGHIGKILISNSIKLTVYLTLLQFVKTASRKYENAPFVEAVSFSTKTH